MIYQKSLKGSDVIFENREKLAEALLSISQAKVTDVVDWDSEGKLKLRIYLIYLNMLYKVLRRSKLDQLVKVLKLRLK